MSAKQIGDAILSNIFWMSPGCQQDGTRMSPGFHQAVTRIASGFYLGFEKEKKKYLKDSPYVSFGMLLKDKVNICIYSGLSAKQIGEVMLTEIFLTYFGFHIRKS
jgi:hypothetical protein